MFSDSLRESFKRITVMRCRQKMKRCCRRPLMLFILESLVKVNGLKVSVTAEKDIILSHCGITGVLLILLHTVLDARIYTYIHYFGISFPTGFYLFSPRFRCGINQSQCPKQLMRTWSNWLLTLDDVQPAQITDVVDDYHLASSSDSLLDHDRVFLPTARLNL